MAYDFKNIDKKWQDKWDKSEIFKASDDYAAHPKKYYALIEFPYPSGKGLHIGHPRPYTAMDIISPPQTAAKPSTSGAFSLKAKASPNLPSPLNLSISACE